MILVFGGTTEGRKAIAELEEAGNVYYYSTKTGEQDVTLHHGVRIDGALDRDAMLRFCRDHSIRLIIDAAHPFAEVLHQTVIDVAATLQQPLIRYDRIYPPHTDDITWCKDYDDAMRQMEAQGVQRLLALTGVNTIGKLHDFWLRHDCWWRILDRDGSRLLAEKHQFPLDHLVYYEHDDTDALISQLHPDAILTKESGESGGFHEKVTAARNADVKIFVIERPQFNTQNSTLNTQHSTFNTQHSTFNIVNGPHGLRRQVEQLLPEFYPLHSGLTTGTCATAAAVADALRRFRGETPSEVPVTLPNGETIHVTVHYADDYAFVIKDSGDDPDVTKGIEIRAQVTAAERHGRTRKEQIRDYPRSSEAIEQIRDYPCSSEAIIEIRGGEGVGRFTLPGFDYPPGEPAINKGPRAMIRQNLATVLSGSPADSVLSGLPAETITVTLSVPGGEETASRTFNPRLGIEGGISIIGVSGIIKPFSEDAFVDSIRKCMQVAKASGSDRVVINSGAKSERFVRTLYPDLPRQAFVEYGNYIGETLKIADELAIPHVTLGVMLGKAVKLAEGQLDTHSRKGTMNRAFVAQMLAEASLRNPKLKIQHSKFKTITLARELWELIPADHLQSFADVVIDHCQQHCAPLLTHGELTILLISDDGDIYKHSNSAPIR